MFGGLGLVLGGIAAVGLGLSLLAWPLINVVETGKTPEYPALLPRHYQISPEEVYEAVLLVVREVPHWRLTASDSSLRTLHVESTTRFLRFVDDIDVRVEADGDGAHVFVRSASRVGTGDFGQNARTIRALFESLDRTLARGATGTPLH